jgi:hypothetical protein
MSYSYAGIADYINNAISSVTSISNSNSSGSQSNDNNSDDSEVRKGTNETTGWTTYTYDIKNPTDVSCR